MSTAAAAAIILALVVVGLDRFGLLDWLKPKSASDYAAELELADRRNATLTAQVVELRASKVKIEQESLEPILELMRINGEQQAQILDRLIHHNGSFRHMEESMSDLRESIRLLAGFVVGATDTAPTGGDR